jgi:ferredoxin-NADP reductase
LDRLTSPDVLTPVERRAPGRWQIGTVTAIKTETPRVKSFRIELPMWMEHLPGQHYDVRLTAPDGYQAQRSYSIGSAPGDPRLALTVERIDDGEVSPYLAGELRAGDELELRGPVGGHFTWRVDDGGPLLLVAGGSGLVPLMAMLRHRATQGSDVDARLLLSARAWGDVLYRDELAGLGDVGVHITLTREQPSGWSGSDRRVDAAMLRELGPAPEERPHVYVCGPTAFVERAADLLVELGHDPSAIRAERFGPTGS